MSKDETHNIYIAQEVERIEVKRGLFNTTTTIYYVQTKEQEQS